MVDTKSSFPNGKYKKRRESTSNLEAPCGDESLLRQPLRTCCTGFSEAMKAYENGTEEVKRLLMQECSLIYECNVCRNMFRSLANFISHKRQYCRSTTSHNIQSFQDTTSSFIIETIERSEPLLIKSRSTGSSPIPNNTPSNRDLSKVIERLKRVDVSSGCNQNGTEAEEKNIELSAPKAPDPILELERVATTAHAVCQTLKRKKDTNSINTEMDAVPNILRNEKTVISPPFVSFSSSKLNRNKPLRNNNTAMSHIFCEICKIPFQTDKTLKMHIQRNHTSTTYVFQCPSCAITFLQPAAVIRHLANEHKKPLRRIRKMRDTILKKRIQIGDVQVKGLCREIQGLRMSNIVDLERSNVVNESGTPILSCSFCLKNFERRAGLATHLVNCIVRKKSPRQDAELSKELRVANDQNIELTTQNEITNQCIEMGGRNVKKNEQESESIANIKQVKQEPKEDLNPNNDNSSNINKLFAKLENKTFGNGLHTVCFENIQMTQELKEESARHQDEVKDEDKKDYNCYRNKRDKKKIRKKDVVKKEKLIQKEKCKRFRVVSASKQLTCRCKICNKQFNALSNLRRHISMFHYRSKRFGCNLCDYRAFRRYDIVNHLTFVHKMNGERESMAVEFVTVHEIKYSKDDVEGDIVVVNDEANLHQHFKNSEQEVLPKEQIETVLRNCQKEKKCKKVLLQSNKNSTDVNNQPDINVVRKKLKKSLETQVEDKKRPIRNRIKTVNNDFVYDLPTNKDELKQTSRGVLKRNSILIDHNNIRNAEITPLPIKSVPYRLRTEPLVPVDKSAIKGIAANVYRNVILESLAAPSTLPELPTERPQMRSRLSSYFRNDANSTIPIIESSELEAAGLKSTFFDDSFLEKFVRKSNPSFKMKPLLAMHHSPLNSILQKFDASQQSNKQNIERKVFQTPPEKDNFPSNYNVCLLPNLDKEKELTPNGKLIFESSSPPTAPKKRITLMERLAENRAKRKDTHLHNKYEYIE